MAEELRNLGIQQLIYCPKGSPLEAFSQREGIEVQTYSKQINLDFWVAFKLALICKKEGVSHVHTHDSPAHTLAVVSYTLFGLRAPIIVHRRVDFKIGKSSFLSFWKYNHPAVVKIICVSNFIKDLIEGSLKRPERLIVVHSGIDLGRFTQLGPAKPSSLRTAFEIPDDSFLIANIAAIAPHKDYFTFVDTAEILIKNGLHATFLAIGGDGGEMKAIEQYISQKNLQGNVILTGFRSNLQEELAELDLLLFTSKTEGLGTSLLDAFVAGVPVVATATGGIPEIVVNGVTGLLCKVGDAKSLAEAVQTILVNSELRQELVEAARNHVLEYSKEKMANAVFNIYQETAVH